MPTINDGLIAHLALNGLVSSRGSDMPPTLPDMARAEPGRLHAAGAAGIPQLVADAAFGAALEFSGEDAYLEITDPFPDPTTFTIAVWVKSQNLPGQGYRAIVGYQDNSWVQPDRGWNARKPSLWRKDEDLHFDAYDGDGVRFTGKFPFFSAGLADDVWVHIAWVKQGEFFHFYRNGELVHSAPAPAAVATTQFGAAYRIGRVDRNWTGRIAHVRFYGRSLEQAEIWQAMHADKYVPYHVNAPLDLKLYDDNEDALLYITDAPGRTTQSLHLELLNRSPTALYLRRTADTLPTAGNHHFALYFRSGTLAHPDRVKLSGSPDAWAISGPHSPTRDKRVIAYYLLWRGDESRADSRSISDSVSDSVSGPARTPFTLLAYDALKLTLTGLAAAAGSGTRNTGIELRTANLFTDRARAQATGRGGDQGELQLTLKRNLKLVNHQGRKHIPLHIDFVGANTVLNNGEPSAPLTLRITNTSHTHPLSFVPDNPIAKPRFVIWFDEGDLQDEWALAEADQVSGIHMNDLPKDDEAPRNQWTLAGSNLPSVLEAHDGSAGQHFFDIAISNIITKHPTGVANLYVRYENIPGYWDGQVVCRLQKSPLTLAGEHVGIGFSKPVTQLHIAEDDPSRPAILRLDSTLVHNSDVTQGFRLFKAYNGRLWGWKVESRGLRDDDATLDFISSQDGVDVRRVTIARASGNVGIGTSNPAVALHIHSGSDVEGDAADSGYLILGDAAGTHLAVDNNEIMAKANGTTPGTLYLQNDGGATAIGGDVGIGTTSPATTLHIRSGSDVESDDANSGYLILGDAAGSHLAVDSNEIMAKANGTTPGTLYLQNGGGAISIGGDVGIGTTSPATTLHIRSGRDVRLDTEGSGFLLIGDAAGKHIAIDNNEIMAKEDGTSAGQLQLQQEGGSTTFGGNVRLMDGSRLYLHQTGSSSSLNWSIYPEWTDSDDPDLMFSYSDSESGWVNGWLEPKSGGWRTHSDARLKTDIAPLGPILDKLMALKPSTFRFAATDPASRKIVGFIAQNVERVLPELVTEKHGYKALTYDDFAVLAVAAIQEQQAQIDELRGQLDELRTQVAELKSPPTEASA